VKNKTGIKKAKPKAHREGRTKLNLLAKRKNWGKNLVDPAILLVADLQLNTGDTELHVVEVRKDSFKLFGKRYITNSEYMKFNRTLNMHVSKYHEGLSLPVNQHIDVNAVKQAIKEYANNGSAEADVINNVDPIILEALVNSTIVQKVFAGAEIDKIFALIKILSIITLLVGSITMFIVLGTSGLF